MSWIGQLREIPFHILVTFVTDRMTGFFRPSLRSNPALVRAAGNEEGFFGLAILKRETVGEEDPANQISAVRSILCAVYGVQLASFLELMDRSNGSIN
jgi:hypothetical protein